MEIHQQQNRPAFLRFETVAVEDRQASAEAGHVVYKDVDFVHATAPGGASTTISKPVQKFLETKKNDEFYRHYKDVYQAWKEETDMPVDGTALSMWPVVTPAQIKMCQSVNIRSVEDLAGAPEDALRKLGMGARSLQQKADAWLKSAGDHGKTAEEIAQLKRDNEAKDTTIAEMRESIGKLQAQIEALQGTSGEQKRGPGRPPKQENRNVGSSQNSGA